MKNSRSRDDHASPRRSSATSMLEEEATKSDEKEEEEKKRKVKERVELMTVFRPLVFASSTSLFPSASFYVNPRPAFRRRRNVSVDKGSCLE